MPIGFIYHGMHGVDDRKVIGSDIYECTDALIFSGFRQCSGALKLPHHIFILRSSLAVSTTIQNIYFSINCMLQHGNRHLQTTFSYSAGGT
jgi:hypothetical protein